MALPDATGNSTKASTSNFLHCKPSADCASSSTLVDGRRSPQSYSLEMAASNSTAPLAEEEQGCYSIDDSARSQRECGRVKNYLPTSKNSSKRKRSTTALLFKPSFCSRICSRLVERLAASPLDTGDTGPRFYSYLLSCKNRNISPNCLILIGACLSFVLIISAYLLGRFLSSPGDCPINGLYGSNSGVSRDIQYALLRDRLIYSSYSKPADHFSPVVRLGRDVIPLHYDVFLDFTDLHNKNVKGTLRVSIECIRSTDSFLIHSSHDHLFISKISISRSDEPSVVSAVGWNHTDESIGGDAFSTVNITLDFTLRPGARYDLHVAYTAAVCGRKSGVTCYEDGQRNRNGYSTIFAATKFEPTAARTLLPCFDEPDLKATFNVTVVRYSDMTVLANTGSWKRVRTRHGQVLEHFETTPPMSTYLLGFVVGPYVRQEKHTERGVSVAVWTRREDRSKGEYALEYSSKMLRIIENYFGINYVLSKLDLVASPAYPVGAMENWGLLIFHQRALLYVNEYRLIGGNPIGHEMYQPYLLPKFRTSKIIVHELLHQWFGNLATMHWWSEIWLNEGFATFFIYHFLKEEYPLLSDFHQTWKLADAWQRQTAYAFWFDQYPYSQQVATERHRLVRNYSSDEEIYEAFDEHHLYAKGGAIVRMLWRLVGENVMKSGLQKYLSDNAFRSVDRWQLWKHLVYGGPGAVSKANGTGDVLAVLMESWLTNPGFPEVKITSNNAQSGPRSTGAFRVEQTMADFRLHCSYLPSDLQSDTKKYTWSIPFSYTVEENVLISSHRAVQVQPIWITNQSWTVVEPAATSGQWILANPDFHFPYRVNYDLHNWSKLIRQLRRRPDRIPMKSRVQLLLDAAFFLKETDDFPYFLDLLGYLRKETDLLPLVLGLREVYSVLDQYRGSSVYPLLVFYFRPVVEQATKIRFVSEREAEMDAVWWLDDSFSLTLKLLQCATRHRQCQSNREEVQSVLSLPTNGQVTDKLIPICEYLRRNFSDTERQILLYWLDQERFHRTTTPANAHSGGFHWRQDVLFMAACVHDRELLRNLMDAALARGDLEFLATSLSSTFTLNYNDFLTTEVWSRLENASVRVTDHSRIEVHLRNMLRSVRTISEFELAQKSLQSLHFGHVEDISFIEARLNWQERKVPALEDWLMQKLELTFL